MTKIAPRFERFVEFREAMADGCEGRAKELEAEIDSLLREKKEIENGQWPDRHSHGLEGRVRNVGGYWARSVQGVRGRHLRRWLIFLPRNTRQPSAALDGAHHRATSALASVAWAK